MACAGYLVQNNRVVYAEVTNGLLVCMPAKCHAEELARQATAAEAASHGLPLLAPRQMQRSASVVLPKLKVRAADAPQPEEEESGDEYDEYDDDINEKAIEEDTAARLMQLSGHVVEVVDCDDEVDEGVVPMLPFSFRVKTKRMTLHADASFTLTPVDSLLLAAVSQTAKDEWMTRLARWKRYGWRETTLVTATQADWDALESTIKQWRANEMRSSMTHAAFGFGSASMRSSRRRFYRPTGIGASAFGTDDDSCEAADAWFNTRVIKTHI